MEEDRISVTMKIGENLYFKNDPADCITNDENQATIFDPLWIPKVFNILRHNVNGMPTVICHKNVDSEELFPMLQASPLEKYYKINVDNLMDSCIEPDLITSIIESFDKSLIYYISDISEEITFVNTNILVSIRTVLSPDQFMLRIKDICNNCDVIPYYKEGLLMYKLVFDVCDDILEIVDKLLLSS